MSSVCLTVLVRFRALMLPGYHCHSPWLLVNVIPAAKHLRHVFLA